MSSLSRPKSPRRDFSFGAAACCGPAHCVTFPLRRAWSLCRAAPCVMFPSFLSLLLRPTLIARARDRLVRHGSRDDGPLVPLPAKGGSSDASSVSRRHALSRHSHLLLFIMPTPPQRARAVLQTARARHLRAVPPSLLSSRVASATMKLLSPVRPLSRDGEIS